MRRTSRNQRRRKNHEKKNHGNRISPIEIATVNNKIGIGRIAIAHNSKIETVGTKIARSNRTETVAIKIVIAHSKIAIARVVIAHEIRIAISLSAMIAIVSNHKSGASALEASRPAAVVAFPMTVSEAASAANTLFTCSAAGVEAAETNAFNTAAIGLNTPMPGPTIGATTTTFISTISTTTTISITGAI